MDNACTVRGWMFAHTCQRLHSHMFGGFPYQMIHDNWRVLDLRPDSLAAWVLTAIGIDFGYYWFHRAGHEVNLIWASHAVHHSSEHYNLSTSLRQSMVQTCFNFVFYLPLAFFFPVDVYGAPSLARLSVWANMPRACAATSSWSSGTRCTRY